MNWDTMTGSFNYEGTTITKNGPNDYTVLKQKATSFGECVLIIQQATEALAASLTREAGKPYQSKFNNKKAA